MWVLHHARTDLMTSCPGLKLQMTARVRILVFPGARNLFRSTVDKVRRNVAADVSRRIILEEK